MIQRFAIKKCLIIYDANFMKQVNNKFVVLMAIVIGTIIGIFKGSEAKQKWVFRIKNRHEEKRQTEENKKLLREGGVPLDDIEMAAFHKS
jgi:uncharacterized membrane protein YqgA involved in biofilm formation